MKIQFIELDEALRVGGLEKAAADMALYLNRRGHEVIRGKDEVLFKEGIQLVHFHGLWSRKHAAECKKCQKHGVPYIISPHGMLEPWAFRHKRWKKLPYFKLVEKGRLARSNRILATAEAEKENLSQYFPSDHIKILSLGIEETVGPNYNEARQALGWGENEQVLLYLSRIHPKKGLLELLQALTQLHSSSELPDNVRLVIMGDGPEDYHTQCRNTAEGLKSEIKIDWYEPKWGEGKWPYMQGADLFCLPTYSENFGIVVLESGIVGTPVFTTTGTPWKVIQENGHGWVPQPGLKNYIPVLKSFFRSTHEERQKMREGIAEWTLKTYGWSRLAEAYESYYEEEISISGVKS